MNPTVLLIAAWLVQIGGLLVLLAGVAYLSMRALDVALNACKVHRLFVLWMLEMMSGDREARNRKWTEARQNRADWDALMAESDQSEREAKERWDQSEREQAEERAGR